MYNERNYELHEFDEWSRNFAACAANGDEFGLLHFVRNDAKRVKICGSQIRINSDACVPNSKMKFVSFVKFVVK